MSPLHIVHRSASYFSVCPGESGSVLILVLLYLTSDLLFKCPYFLLLLYWLVEHSRYNLLILSTGSVGAMLYWFKAWKPEPKNRGGLLVVFDTIEFNIMFDILGLYTVNPCVLYFTLFSKHCIESLMMIC